MLSNLHMVAGQCCRTISWTLEQKAPKIERDEWESQSQRPVNVQEFL